MSTYLAKQIFGKLSPRPSRIGALRYLTVNIHIYIGHILCLEEKFEETVMSSEEIVVGLSLHGSSMKEVDSAFINLTKVQGFPCRLNGFVERLLSISLSAQQMDCN